MRLTFLIIFCLSFLYHSTYSQTCLPGGLTLSTQSQIDNFASNYPGCTEIDGTLIIEGDDITNLQGLSQIAYIDGDLIVSNTNNLSDLNGLDNLMEIYFSLEILNTTINSLSGLGGLTIIGYDLILEDNPNLSSLASLLNLAYLGSDLEIQNTGLINLEGLNNVANTNSSIIISNNELLEEISALSFFAGDAGLLEIKNNPALLSLNGLNNITSVDFDLYIIDNLSLTDLSGLNSLTYVGHELIIENNGLVSLNGLESLTAIDSDFEISQNPNLIDLSGLGNLAIVSHFYIHNNTALNSFNGLNNLTTVSFFDIIGNNALNNFSGLNNLAHVDNMYIELNNSLLSLDGLNSLATAGDIYIEGNPSLVSLNGLNSLTAAVDISVYDNSSLVSLIGLEHLSSINDLTIAGNTQLALCHYPYSICQLFDVATEYDFFSNAPGCESVDEVLLQCDEEYISVYFPLFFDANENKIMDSDESFYPDGLLHISPLDIMVTGNPNDGGHAYLEEGTYTFTFDPLINPSWELTTDSLSYTISIDTISEPDTIYFGVHPLLDISDTKSYLVADNVRCNQLVLFSPFVKNEGTTISNGTLWLEVDSNIQAVQYLDIPDTIIAPNLYGWFFEGLYPGHKIQKQISLQIPGPPDFPIGSYIHFTSYTDYNDANGNHSFVPFYYNEQVLCSWDPNDKLVNPVYPDNYALMDQDLVYTIRFQNTGNAVAYDVVIRDTLDANLDPASFQFISSSHEEVLNTLLEVNQFLTFNFHNIFLPDSTTNFDGSQGYVMYSLRPNEGLPEETVINNTASIYFDLNPPVVTNTTENTLRSTFDLDEDGFEVWLDCDDTNPDANPDGIEIANNGIDEDCDGEDLMVSNKEIDANRPEIFPNPTSSILEVRWHDLAVAEMKLNDFIGQLVLRKAFQGQGSIDLSNLPSGVYFLLIQAETGVWTERVVKL